MTTVIMKQDVSQLTQGDIAFFRLDEPTRTFARYGIEKEQAFGEHEKGASSTILSIGRVIKQVTSHHTPPYSNSRDMRNRSEYNASCIFRPCVSAR